jgi:hypothetical protein
MNSVKCKVRSIIESDLLLSFEPQTLCGNRSGFQALSPAQVEDLSKMRCPGTHGMKDVGVLYSSRSVMKWGPGSAIPLLRTDVGIQTGQIVSRYHVNDLLLIATATGTGSIHAVLLKHTPELDCSVLKEDDSVETINYRSIIQKVTAHDVQDKNGRKIVKREKVVLMGNEYKVISMVNGKVFLESVTPGEWRCVEAKLVTSQRITAGKRSLIGHTAKFVYVDKRLGPNIKISEVSDKGYLKGFLDDAPNQPKKLKFIDHKKMWIFADEEQAG